MLLVPAGLYLPSVQLRLSFAPSLPPCASLSRDSSLPFSPGEAGADLLLLILSSDLDDLGALLQVIAVTSPAYLYLDIGFSQVVISPVAHTRDKLKRWACYVKPSQRWRQKDSLLEKGM